LRLERKINVWSSRDVALIILFAVLNLVFAVLIGQVPDLIVGVHGISLVFTIVYSINQSVAWLLFQGRRWRIFAMGLLLSSLALLAMPTILQPHAAMAAILDSFIVDAFFNSLYGSFKRKNKLPWWILSAQVFSWGISPFLILAFSAPFFPIGAVIANWFIPIMSVVLPVMIVEAIAGSFIGYKIYKKVEKIT
jgi:hypothetical protein